MSVSSTEPSSIDQQFQDAQTYIQIGPKSSQDSSNETKLAFYALFKQASTGPLDEKKNKRPGMFDLVARAKYDAWKKLGQMSKTDAMKAYMDTLTAQSPDWRQWMMEHNNKKKQQQQNEKRQEQKLEGTSPILLTASATMAKTQDTTTTSSSSSVFKSDCLKGKVAIVTGGGSGICKDITLYLMQHGCHTAIISRNLEKLQHSAQELESIVNNNANNSQSSDNKVRCVPLSADVRDYAKLELAFDQVLSQLGRIDILINGAAGNFLAPAEKLSPNAFRTVLEIDTFGTFYASKLAYVKYMKQHGGSIVNLSMTLHHQAMPLQVHAGCAKSAIDAMTKHLAVEWGPTSRVRVNAIAIGPIEGTEGFSRLMSKEALEQMRRKIPIQRWGTVRDISNAVLYLVSDAASYVTGTVLTVDGGAVYTTGGMGYPESTMKMSKL